jgi:hypothetical protein
VEKVAGLSFFNDGLIRTGDSPLGRAEGNMMTTELASPTCSPTDIQYEADCRAALRSALGELLDLAELAGWSRRRAAYALMMLATDELRSGRESQALASEDTLEGAAG